MGKGDYNWHVLIELYLKLASLVEFPKVLGLLKEKPQLQLHFSFKLV